MVTVRKMMIDRKIRIILNLIGASALIAIIILFVCVSRHFSVKNIHNISQPHYNRGSISFDSDEIIYDGTSPLDLMAGVMVDDGNGNDITDEANAIITSGGTLNRKIVRYSCFDAGGHTLTATRTLVMKDYTGPSLEISDSLDLDAENLDDLISHLYKNSLLSSYDGFGKNISSRVTCQRECVSTGTYKMTFRVINDYQDEKTVVVNARISGKVEDPFISLYSNSVSVPFGEKFEPMNFVVSQSPCVGKIDIDSSVNTMVPGNYRVIYTAYSTDMTAKSTKTMQVTVTGDASG